MKRAKEPFIFKTQLSLVQIAGHEAGTLAELNSRLKRVPESSIYYHTHHFLQQHQFLTPEPPNDFAYWVTEVLGDDQMGERLAAIDTMRYNSLEGLRDALVAAIDSHLKKGGGPRQAPPGEEFYFMKCVLFTLPVGQVAQDLGEFIECLKRVSIGCLYNHIFAARLRPPLGVNDFSYWLRTGVEEPGLAAKIERLDPYTQTMEGLRNRIIQLIEGAGGGG